MKSQTLLVEHRQNGRVLKKLRLTHEGRPLIIGASNRCDIRLLGPEVSPFHACLESRQGRWFIFDFGSTTGTWVDKESVLEKRIEKAIVVKVGLHELYLLPVEPMRDLFPEKTGQPVAPHLDVHQVVLRTETGVIDSFLLKKDESFELKTTTGKKTFLPPKTSEWVTTREGKVVIQQRLIGRPSEAPNAGFKVDQDMKWPYSATVLTLLISVLIIGLRPLGPGTPKALPEIPNNQFANLIFDAKLMAEKKKESKELQQKKFQGSQKGAAGNGGPANQIAKGNSPAPNKLISQVKAKGLSQLIGKIAKRANSNTELIQSVGRIAEEGGGRAVASAGVGLEKASVGAGGSPSGTGYKLAAVGTGGKGGGGSYKEGTGLGVGNVGKSNVGIVEEETDVSGGLDKDVIAEVIKSEIGQIRYCYERQLPGNRDLAGKVQIKFSIGAEGSVIDQRIGLTELKNADVEGCILRRVTRWKFPQPKGGTIVNVTYPFFFKSMN